jgi:hypothetical protein
VKKEWQWLCRNRCHINAVVLGTITIDTQTLVAFRIVQTQMSVFQTNTSRRLDPAKLLLIGLEDMTTMAIVGNGKYLKSVPEEKVQSETRAVQS